MQPIDTTTVTTTPAAPCWTACPENAPPDGYYWVRYGRKRDLGQKYIREVRRGLVQFDDGDCIPWQKFVRDWARQYWSEPVSEPPDE